ncbi:conserved Plasmodium protein, unknown function [Plasmodium ovale]|uniref:Uncharacterized protein n=2 Tax=Plasmodium ovale TaxID=36330 RepID=A0A1A8X2Z1_PLAOA|nr:hypothetical protein, conserved [Plasmodium ovale curtisi]SBS98117.1 hypothetical protein, conserved [Plasmodium ovale curtisi]SCQ16859.1 conserved Plasmodium protein, unknown function [Plasmodium ovale]
MDTPTVEAAFLIYNIECNSLKNEGKSGTIRELNRRINKYSYFLLSSSYKHVNNFTYTTDVLHCFYKVVEYYILKYYNGIVIDSTLFFKCINDIKNRSSDMFQNGEKENDINYHKNEDAKNDQKSIGNVCHAETSDTYLFDYKVLSTFIENLKKKYNQNKEKKDKVNEKRKGMKKKEKHNSNIQTDSNAHLGMESHNCRHSEGYKTVCKKCTKINNVTENFPFRKKFLYELCEMNSSFDNKKNRMVYITKIFRKIINRKLIRQFICENDKIMKKNYFKFFLHLSLGIFIYLYIYKYVKRTYKNMEFFVFLNDLKNIRHIYINNIPYIEKQQMYSFVKYVKFLNIQMFRYIYISFFVNIYKYINLIHNVTLLTLYNYVTQMKERKCARNKMEPMKEIEATNNPSSHSHKQLENALDEKFRDTICADKNHADGGQNFVKGSNLAKRNALIAEEELLINEHAQNLAKTSPEKYSSEIINNSHNKHRSALNNKREEGKGKSGLIKKSSCEMDSYASPSNEKKKCNDHPLKNNRQNTDEMIFDCYIYVFIFFKYIRDTRKWMKSRIIKIQINIKKMIGLFIHIYNMNKEAIDIKKALSKNREKKSDLSITLTNSIFEDNNVKDSLHSLYFNYLQLSKYYKSCIKINYEIIESVHMFHILLKHFYNYFPILNNKKGKCTIYNYYDKCEIHCEKTEESEESEKSEKTKKKDKSENKKKNKNNFNIFKNVNDYELDFFYFNDIKNDEKEVIHDLTENNKVESFDEIFDTEGKATPSASASAQNCGEDHRGKAKEKECEECENPGDNLIDDNLESSKRIFLRCINDLDTFLVNVDREFSLQSDTTKMEANALTTRENISSNFSFLRSSSVLQNLRHNKTIYNKIMENVENFCNSEFPTMKNCLSHLGTYDKKVLDIYDSNIFDVCYKFKNGITVESEESIKNKKLLEVKIFLDYEKLYTKRTVETQTHVSLFKKDKLIQIAKDKEVSTISDQHIQAKKICNPIFYLKDIYD